ncbi:hypothetical protein GCM10029963_05910 [Micromonospora andamanensis]
MSRVLTRASALLAALCLLLLSAAQTPRAAAAALDPFTGYLMAHFTGESATGEQVYFAHSRDGLTWRDLNNGAPVLLSTIGTRGVRDPSLLRSPTGDRYWIVATDLRIASGTSWNDAANRGSTSLVVWESRDLVNWSAPWLINVAGAIPGAGNAWAPEAIYNQATGDYVVYWATNSLRDGVTKHRIWYVRTSDFRSFTAPQLYIERPGGGQGIIDTQIVEVPGSVGGYRYYRASADGHITIEASNSILGSWTTLGNLSTSASPTAPAVATSSKVRCGCSSTDVTSGRSGSTSTPPDVATCLSPPATWAVSRTSGPGLTTSWEPAANGTARSSA